MKEETRKRLAKLILEELSDKIKVHESLGHKLEAFTDLPVEKVADAILKQFEYLLSSDLRDLIIHLIEQEVAAENVEADSEIPLVSFEHPESYLEILTKEKFETEKTEKVPLDDASRGEDVTEPELLSSESIMEHFAAKEPFPTQPMDIPLTTNDWLYIFGFSYAPDSAGKGIPTIKLALKGID